MVASFQYIEQIIANYQAATAANGNTPGRLGSTVTLEAAAGDDVMITGDLHGHRRNFNAIKKIADLEHHPRRHLVLQEVCHGGPTYPGGAACMSHGMLEDVAKLKAQYPNRVHFLLGNHELAELTDYPILKAKKMLNLMFRLGMQEMYGAAADKVRDAYLPFLRSCPLAVRLPGGVLVCHSTPENVDARGFDASIFSRDLEPLDLMEQSDVFRLLWGRDYRPANAAAFAGLVGAKVLINGHEPCRDGFQVPNDIQIILDCCGDKACYVLLGLNRDWTHAQIVEQIRTL